jgi:hypothetical protein
MGLGVASDTASRGQAIFRSFGMGNRMMSRPRILGLGISSDAAGAGHSETQHIF